jgi:DNA topoisomerase-1
MSQTCAPDVVPVLVEASTETLADAGLRYSTDSNKGLTRHRRGKNFVYLDQHGKPVRDADVISRINALAIPPAYTEVWICADARGHLQATGRDARGRKQYRYHPDWRVLRDSAKFERMASFGAALPRMRARINRDLALPGMQREKILATVVKMLDTTLVRVGGAEYARDNHSYGLTTLRKKHLQLRGDLLRLKFTGKSGIEHDVTIRDRRILRIVRRCMEIAGQDLFQYVDEAGQRHTVSSSAINAYLGEISGFDFTAKDYRTWAGSVHALATLRTVSFATETQNKKNIVVMVKDTARLLRNTPAVCRRCYIHPELLNAYMAGRLSNLPRPKRITGLKNDEALLLEFLRAATPAQHNVAA